MAGRVYITDKKAWKEIRKTSTGVGAAPARTLWDSFKDRLREHPDEIACLKKVNLDEWRPGFPSSWRDYTWADYYNECRRFAKSALKIGLKRFDGIAILGFNSPEWFFSAMGGMMAGGINVGLYTTSDPKSSHYIITHSGSTIISVENNKQLKKLLEVEYMKDVKAIVMWAEEPEQELIDSCKYKIFAWEDWMSFGEDIADKDVEAAIAAQQPEHVCSMVYTSGTTGMPKSVMISHDNYTWTTDRLVEEFQFTAKDRVVSYLPLSHIAGQVVDMIGPICSGARTYFALPNALKGGLVPLLQETRPTIFLGVPRVWEKIMEGMRAKGAAASPVLRAISSAAKYIGLWGGYNRMRGQPVPWGWTLAKLVVFNKVKRALGLDQVRLFTTAAAPISKETMEYFLSLDIPLMEVYGMSECTGPMTSNKPATGFWRIGSQGRAIEGMELKIDQPDAEGNGEICFRGRHIFQGYYKNPEATASTIDEDGWLHSGDVGKLEDGWLYITGRIKELIITAGGENIPPVLIEDVLKKELPAVSNAMVIGDRRRFLSVLITLKVMPNVNAPEGEYEFFDTLTAEALTSLRAAGYTGSDKASEAVSDPAVKAYIQAGIDRYNQQHAISNAQRLQKFALLPRDFTLSGGELTPTMKLKRKVTAQKYDQLVESFYQ